MSPPTDPDTSEYYEVDNVGLFRWTSTTIGTGENPGPPEIGQWYYHHPTEMVCQYHEGLPWAKGDILLEVVE